MNYCIMITGLFLCSLAGNASAAGCEENIVFDGKDAGQVVFSVSVHTTKGYTCSYCHEGHGLSFALFNMKKGSDTITMRKMELGSSCGYCHDGKEAFSATDILSCSKCHRK